MMFNDFVRKHDLKTKATSIIKIQHILSSLSLDDVGIYLTDGQFSTDIGIVNSNPSKATQWIRYINENYFDSYGFAPPKKFPNLI